MELPVTQLTFKNICRTCMSTSNDLNSLFDYIEIGSEKIELNIALLKCTSVEVLFLLIQSTIMQFSNFSGLER